MSRRKSNQPKKNYHRNAVKFSVSTDNVFDARVGRRKDNRKGIAIVNTTQDEFQFSSGELSSSQESSSQQQARSQNVPHPNRNRQIGPMIMRPSRKFKPGTVALREIRRYQKSTELLIPKAPFKRFVKQILVDKGHDIVRIQQQALEALQQATEAYFTEVLEDANLCAIHAKRQTVFSIDFELVRKINKKKLN